MLFYVPKGDGSDVILDGIDEGEFNAFLEKAVFLSTGVVLLRGTLLQAIGWTGSI